MNPNNVKEKEESRGTSKYSCTSVHLYSSCERVHSRSLAHVSPVVSPEHIFPHLFCSPFLGVTKAANIFGPQMNSPK